MRPTILPSRRGFSFTEVLFAVMVLGIGFIMIAAIFPVAIQQSKTNTEETVGSTIVRGAVNYIGQIADNTTMPATGGLVYPFAPDEATAPAIVNGNDNLWRAIRGNLIVANDPRYAWVGMYRRDVTGGVPASYAQIFIIPVESRSRDIFQTNPDAVRSLPETPPTIAHPVTLMPRRLVVTLNDGGATDVDTVEIDTTATENADFNAIAEGAYIIVANNTLDPENNGRIFRVGNRRADLDTGSNVFWELMPGSDMEENDGTSIPGDVLTAGRGYEDPTAPGTAFQGPAMDIGVYTTFVKIN